VTCGEPPVPSGRGVTGERIDFEKNGSNRKPCRRNVLVPIGGKETCEAGNVESGILNAAERRDREQELAPRRASPDL